MRKRHPSSRIAFQCLGSDSRESCDHRSQSTRALGKPNRDDKIAPSDAAWFGLLSSESRVTLMSVFHRRNFCERSVIAFGSGIEAPHCAAGA